MIYFIQDQTTLLIKIGYTGNDAEGRLKDFQTGCPSGLVLLLAIPGSKPWETQLHHQFAAYRERGEWFRPAPELLQFILEQLKRQLSPPPPPPWLDLENKWVRCPQCQCEYNHLTDIAKTFRSVGCPRELESCYITLACENGHVWELSFLFHEGQVDLCSLLLPGIPSPLFNPPQEMPPSVRASENPFQ